MPVSFEGTNVEVKNEGFRCSECGTRRDKAGGVCPECQAHTPVNGAIVIYVRR